MSDAFMRDVALAAADDPVLMDAAQEEAPFRLDMPERLTDRQADCLVRALAAGERRYARSRAVIEEEIVRLRERASQLEESHAAFASRLEGALDCWLQFKPPEGAERYIDLPSGRVGRRATPPKLTIRDEAALLRWAHAFLPTAVQQSVSKDAVRQHALATGEEPPGTTLSSEDRLYWRAL